MFPPWHPIPRLPPQRHPTLRRPNPCHPTLRRPTPHNPTPHNPTRRHPLPAPRETESPGYHPVQILLSLSPQPRISGPRRSAVVTATIAELGPERGQQTLYGGLGDAYRAVLDEDEDDRLWASAEAALADVRTPNDCLDRLAWGLLRDLVVAHRRAPDADIRSKTLRSQNVGRRVTLTAPRRLQHRSPRRQLTYRPRRRRSAELRRGDERGSGGQARG